MISNQGSQRNFFAGTDRLRRASGHIQMDSKYRRINHDCCINIRFIESQLTVTETRMRLPARTPPRLAKCRGRAVDSLPPPPNTRFTEFYNRNANEAHLIGRSRKQLS